jgi:hypothetical protein
LGSRLRPYFLIGIERSQRTRNRASQPVDTCFWPVYAAVRVADNEVETLHVRVLKATWQDGRVRVDTDSAEPYEVEDCALLANIDLSSVEDYLGTAQHVFETW